MPVTPTYRDTPIDVSRGDIIRLKNRIYRQYQDKCGPGYDTPKAFHLVGMLEAIDLILDMEQE